MPDERTLDEQTEEATEEMVEDTRTLTQMVNDIRGEVVVWLSDHNIFKRATATNKVFALLEKDFPSNTDIPSVYVKKLWQKYMDLPERLRNNALNGYVFEAIIITTLLKEGIRPLYTQTNLAFIPNVNYDIVVFPRKEDGTVDVSAPVVISLKTSLRERYKQADLEGIALKNVYKRASSYLITLDDEEEIALNQEKIKQRDILGIDDFINAGTEAFDELVAKLKGRTVTEPPQIQVIENPHIIE